MPLLRYSIGDAGGLMGYHELMAFLLQTGFNPLESDILVSSTRPNPRILPFVWVFGRAFWTGTYTQGDKHIKTQEQLIQKISRSISLRRQYFCRKHHGRARATTYPPSGNWEICAVRHFRYRGYTITD